MKTKRFFSFIILLLSLTIISCKTTKTITAPKTSEPPIQKLEQKKAELWYQSTYPAIDKSDPVTFFNEYEINLTAEIPKTVVMFKDGATYQIDSSTVVSYTIPMMTPGVLVEAKRENGQLVEMVVSFDENDPNYNCTFRLTTNKTFTLNANKKISYLGKDYYAKATIKGDGSGINRIRSNFYAQKSQVPIIGSAAGRSAAGVKIISK
jgi:hypothetical protein